MNQRADEHTILLPVAEERLSVQKETREIGEVLLRRSVTEERQTVPVEVSRETLRVTRRDVPGRVALPAEAQHAFTGGLTRIPVFAEETEHVKRPFVTGEVVVHRRPVIEERTVSETVRREKVEVEQQLNEPVRAEVASEVIPVARPAAVAPDSQTIVRPNDAFTEVIPALRPSALWRDVKEGWSRGRRARS